MKPRQQNDEMMSAEMLFYGNDHSKINMLFIFWSPVFYLVHPEARDSKFKEHAKPAVEPTGHCTVCARLLADSVVFRAPGESPTRRASESLDRLRPHRTAPHRTAPAVPRWR